MSRKTYRVTEQVGENGDQIVVCAGGLLDGVIEFALDAAEYNGYLSDDESRAVLKDKLVKDRFYTDGEITVRIAESFD